MTSGIGGMDPGSLQRKAMEAAQEIGRETGSAKPPSSGAETNDVERFREAMSGDEAQKTASPPAAEALAPGSPSSSDGLGDRILHGMSSAGEKIQAGRNEAMGILGKENVTQADLLRANFSMLESSTMVSAIAKTTEKITQGVKTLQQG